jgi:hypothetical protein
MSVIDLQIDLYDAYERRFIIFCHLPFLLAFTHHPSKFQNGEPFVVIIDKILALVIFLLNGETILA